LVNNPKGENRGEFAGPDNFKIHHMISRSGDWEKSRGSIVSLLLWKRRKENKITVDKWFHIWYQI